MAQFVCSSSSQTPQLAENGKKSGESLTVQKHGTQTRSVCYVSNMYDAVKLFSSTTYANKMRELSMVLVFFVGI
ncbi:hypothetical protein PTKIN_Ptkin09bG0119900 [Pterospermum kingtungense]